MLFKLQAEVYGLYHMTNPQVFFNREDLWTVATETGSDADGEQTAQPMQPNFVLMKLPGETGEEFVEILPFTPANRNNLIGWIAGRCDGDHYGTSVVYDFPKTRLVDGPQQIEARIDQNAQLSGQLTLWNQQGSHVVRGSLLVIPSGKRPALRRADLPAGPAEPHAGAAPGRPRAAGPARLRRRPLRRRSLRSSAGERPRSRRWAAPRTRPCPACRRRQTRPDQRGLIAEAGRDFDDYQRLTAQGKLAEAGQKLDALKHVLDELNATGK